MINLYIIIIVFCIPSPEFCYASFAFTSVNVIDSWMYKLTRRAKWKWNRCSYVFFIYKLDYKQINLYVKCLCTFLFQSYFKSYLAEVKIKNWLYNLVRQIFERLKKQFLHALDSSLVLYQSDAMSTPKIFLTCPQLRLGNNTAWLSCISPVSTEVSKTSQKHYRIYNGYSPRFEFYFSIFNPRRVFIICCVLNFRGSILPIFK